MAGDAPGILGSESSEMGAESSREQRALPGVNIDK